MKFGKVGLKVGRLALLSALLVACTTPNKVIETYDGQVDQKLVATVIVPPAVNLLSVDGDSYHNLFLHGEKNYQFLPGSYDVQVQYERVWEPSADDHTVVSSEAVTQQWNLQAGTTYQLEHDQAETLAASKKVAEKFVPWLTIENQPEQPVTISKKDRAAMPESIQLQELKRWWQKASEVDQQRFREWLQSAE